MVPVLPAESEPETGRNSNSSGNFVPGKFQKMWEMREFEGGEGRSVEM